jgi:ribosomal protein S27E
MGDITDIDSKRPHSYSSTRCRECGYEWMAVFPEETDYLECPSCHTLVINKKASELLLESAYPFDAACLKVKEIEEDLQDAKEQLRQAQREKRIAYNQGLRDAIEIIESLYNDEEDF